MTLPKRENNIITETGEKEVKFMTEYLSYREAMNYMGFKTQDTLRTYIKQGLPTIKVGKSKRISKSDIDDFMAAHRVVVKSEK